MDCLLSVFEDVGLPIAPSKLEGPTKLTFLGIEIDTITMTIRLPAGKLAALQEMIRSWLGRKSCTHRELESLVGSLSHTCCVVRPGKTYLRRLFELLSIARHSHNFLTAECHLSVRFVLVVFLFGPVESCIILSDSPL